jgi:hypothetical protein
MMSDKVTTLETFNYEYIDQYLQVWAVYRLNYNNRLARLREMAAVSSGQRSKNDFSLYLFSTSSKAPTAIGKSKKTPGKSMPPSLDWHDDTQKIKHVIKNLDYKINQKYYAEQLAPIVVKFAENKELKETALFFGVPQRTLENRLKALRTTTINIIQTMNEL